MTHQTTNKPFIYWLRWFLVLPGALIATFLVTFPLDWLLSFLFANNGTFLGFIELSDGANVVMERALYPIFIAFAFVVTGYNIAPKHKYYTSIVLSALYVVVLFSSYLFMAEQYYPDILSFVDFIGLGAGLYLAHRQSKKIV